MKFSCSALFHINTIVCGKYFVRDCWSAWFQSRNYSKILNPQVTWPYLLDTMSNLALRHQEWRKKIHAELRQLWIWGIFHWRNGFCGKIEWHHNFLQFENFLIVRHNWAKFDTIICGKIGAYPTPRFSK